MRDAAGSATALAARAGVVVGEFSISLYIFPPWASHQMPARRTERALFEVAAVRPRLWLLLEPVFNVGLIVVDPRLRIGRAICSYDSHNPSQFSRTAGNRPGRAGRDLPSA